MYALLLFYYALPGPALVRWVTAKGSSDSLWPRTNASPLGAAREANLREAEP
jgi:hypothetical protein